MKIKEKKDLEIIQIGKVGKKDAKSGSQNDSKNGKVKILSKNGNTIRFPASSKPVLFGATIKQARTRLKISQEQFADIMGVTRFTIMNWEANKNKPDYDLIPKICAELDLTTQELFGVKNDYTDFERNIIRDIRLLKPASQRVAAGMISTMVEKELLAHDEMLLNTTRIVAEEPSAVAAGKADSGVEFTGINETPFFLCINDRTKNADAVVRVKGESMEPDYPDGSTVYFEYTSVANVHDDVVVAWGDKAFIKRLDSDGTLYSINKKHPFIYEGDGDDIHILGRVLGVINDNDTPSSSDMDSLNELFRDELAAFYRERGIE